METGLAEETLAVVEKYKVSYLAHDAEELSRVYSFESRLVAPGFELHGREKVRELWNGWFSALPDVSSTWGRIVVQGPMAMMEWTETGTHTGRLRLSIADIPSTGKTLSWRGVTILEIDDGTIAAHTWHFDRMELALQLLSTRSAVPLLRAVLRSRRSKFG